ncbi:MAG TPA: hypothetical protein DDZ65_09795, partial [Firmicutes bacterium]|nr:hypothetical protein [Bacillota bacterium]
SMFFQYLMTALIGGQFFMYSDFMKTSSINVGDLTIPVLNIYMLAISTVTLIVLLYLLYKTKIGIAIRAASSDLLT